MPPTRISESPPLTDLITTFLTDLANADRSVHTQRAYATELRRLAAFHTGPITTMTPPVLRTFFAQHSHLKPASRARMQAALTRFFTWVAQHDVIPTNPMTQIEVVTCTGWGRMPLASCWRH